MGTNKNKKQHKKKRNTTTSSTTTWDNNSKEEEEEEEKENGDDTCGSAIFDSYLLGNRDDITRAIVKSIQTKEELKGSCGINRKNKNKKNCNTSKGKNTSDTR